ncbi:hypothetical protein IE077_001284, partial [Cardiosporidium cionae]
MQELVNTNEEYGWYEDQIFYTNGSYCKFARNIENPNVYKFRYDVQPLETPSSEVKQPVRQSSSSSRSQNLSNEWYPHFFYLNPSLYLNTPSTIKFDAYKELLWIGSHQGHLDSYFFPSFGRYSSFPIDWSNPTSVQALATLDSGILAITEKTLGCYTRGGMSTPFLSRDVEKSILQEDISLRDGFLHRDGGLIQLIVGAEQPKIFLMDVSMGVVSAYYTLPHGVNKLSHPTLPSIGFQSKPVEEISGESVRTPRRMPPPPSSSFLSYPRGIPTSDIFPSPPSVPYSSSPLGYPIICIGGNDGHVSILDTRKAKVLKTFDAHGEIVTSISVSGQYVATCGGSFRHESHTLLPESFVKIFDIRMLRSAAPVWMSCGASAAKFHPSFAETLVAARSDGFWETMTLSNLYNRRIYRLPTLQGPLVDFDISSSGKTIAFLDTTGSIHQFQAMPPPYVPQANPFSSSISLVTPLSPPQSLTRSIEDSLCTEIFPYLGTYASRFSLLSDKWKVTEKEIDRLSYTFSPSYTSSTSMEGFHFGGRNSPSSKTTRKKHSSPNFPGIRISPCGLTLEGSTSPLDREYSIQLECVHRLPLLIPEKLLKNAKRVNELMYVENFEKWPPNSLIFGVFKASVMPRSSPFIKRFSRSRKEKNLLENLKTFSSEEKSLIPKAYRFFPLQYKIIETMNYHEELNTTDFAGIENGTPFDFMHSILQILYFSPPLKDTFKTHVCDVEFCLSCEVGFLFKSMDRIRFIFYRQDENSSLIYQTFNFDNALLHLPEINLLGFLRPAHERSVILRRIASFYRFLLESFSKDMDRSQCTIVNDLFTISLSSTLQCMKASHVHTLHKKSFLVDLEYSKASFSSSPVIFSTPQRSLSPMEDAASSPDRSSLPIKFSPDSPSEKEWMLPNSSPMDSFTQSESLLETPQEIQEEEITPSMPSHIKKGKHTQEEHTVSTPLKTSKHESTLRWPEAEFSSPPSFSHPSFCDILENSLKKQILLKSYCMECRQNILSKHIQQ